MTARLDLPDLHGESGGEVEVGLIARAEALRLIESALVADDQGSGPRPAPWGTGPARQWWVRTVLPAAREHTGATWWIRRAPREALSWAIALDPRGAEVSRQD
ncbi:hypothetical protein GCM10028787_31160 [Brachybacterium horti]